MPKESVDNLCMIYASEVPSIMASKTDSLWSGSLEQNNQYLRYWPTLPEDQ
jgi:hypothetical protein